MKIEVEYSGNLRMKSVHTDSGSELVTDAPKDNAGNGMHFSPTDLLATSLITCMITTMGIVGKKHEFPELEATGSVEKIMYNDPRRVGKLVIHIQVTSPVTQQQWLMLERAALQCPVIKSLSPEIEIEHQIQFQNPV